MVKLFVDGFEVRVSNMGIDLRRTDIAVAKQSLDGAQVRTVHK